jgi:hypothetical protein
MPGDVGCSGKEPMVLAIRALDIDTATGITLPDMQHRIGSPRHAGRIFVGRGRPGSFDGIVNEFGERVVVLVRNATS